MAATVIKAVMDKIASLTAANFPSATIPKTYQDEAPVTESDGSQKYQPYIIISNPDTSTEYQSDQSGVEAHDIELEVFADSAADVNTICEALKFNGATPTSRSGLDNASSLSLSNPYYFLSMIRQNNPRAYAGLGKQGQRVYSATMTYQVKLGILATY